MAPEACRASAYLCAGLAERGEPRVLRWSTDTREIRIHVPPPPVASKTEARALQDAAVSGILAWQAKPIPLRVLRSTGGEEVDIVVRWVDRLGGTELGRVETEWVRRTDGAAAMRVRSFELALRNPFDASRGLTPDQVQLTAAHEMGHALGLPHSDSPRDVMHPTNTATTISPRDYQAMAALYRMENGAIVDPDVVGPGP